MFLGTNRSLNLHLCAALTASLTQRQLDAAVELVVQSLGSDIVTISLFNASGEQVLTGHHGLSATYLAKWTVTRPGEYNTANDWQHAKPMFLDNDLQNNGQLPPEMAEIAGLRAVAISPLRHCGLTLGIAAAGWRRPLLGPLLPDDLSVFEVVGHMLGTAASASQLHRLDKRRPDSRTVLREKRRSFFDEETDAVLVCDPTRQLVVEANLAAARTTGYGLGELEGMPLARLFPGADMPSVLAQRGNADPQHGTSPLEVQLLSRDGAVVTVEATTRVTFQRDGLSLIELTVEDITQQKRVQELTSLRIREVIRATEDERKRLAWQLHEETIQSLLQVTRQLQEIGGAKSRRIPSETRAAVEECASVISATSQHIREFCHNLRPSILDDLGLVSALKWLTRSLNEKRAPVSSLEIIGEERRLPADTELALFRIVQEGLSNVQRHAGAARVSVRVDFEVDRIIVRVADDGRGFEPPRRLLDLAKDGKIGLLSIQDRVQIVGGTLRVESQPGKGTELWVFVPCPSLPRTNRGQD